MKVREMLRLLETDGWYLVATVGSHRQYKHPRKLGRVTVAGNLGKDPGDSRQDARVGPFVDS